MKTSIGGAPEQGGMARRRFLRYAAVGAATATAALTGACTHYKDVSNPRSDIGGGDIGILNYAYALEMLQAAFYTQAVANPYSGITATETTLLTDIRDHEVAHRDLFKTTLAGNGITGLKPYFGSVNFSSRYSVLSTAKILEDLGVAAYNGLAALIQNTDYLALAVKIVSVEARHAALIRDLLQYNSFIDSGIVDVNSTSLEKSKTMAEVLPVANQYLGAVKLSAQVFGIL